MEKADLIKEYIELKNNLGRRPSSAEFYNSLKNGRRLLEKTFGEQAWNKLVCECGDVPKDFFKEKSDFDKILIQYGNLFRELKRHPSSIAWDYRNYIPTVDGIIRTNKIKWSDMPQKFLEFAYGKTEWQDVIDLIPEKHSIIKSDEIIIEFKVGQEVSDFIPPIVQNLIQLSYDDSNSAFEKKVNLIFEMLGFEVRQLGQGTGRKPDGIALFKSNPRYAILIDSKSRCDGYKFGTDDRAFVEYIKTYSGRLQSDGFDKLYFIVVSSHFVSIPLESIKRLALETHVPISFLSSRLLLKMLSKKIETPRLFDLNKFRDLLFENGEIFETKVDRFLQNIQKQQAL